MRRSTASISPTAYATGAMWVRLGLSHAVFATAKGRALDFAFSSLLLALRPLGGYRFDDLMRARHRGIDATLDAAIERGEVQQVLEIAVGLSGRALRLRARFGSRVRVVETDLPAMIATRRRLLAEAGLLPEAADLRVLDALAESGPDSLAALVASLDRSKGLAIITEGLMNYLEPAQAQALWRNVAMTLRQFPSGLYLADAYLSRETGGALSAIFRSVLARFTKGSMHLHFSTEAQAKDLLRSCGFAEAELTPAHRLAANADIADSSGAKKVRVLSACAV